MNSNKASTSNILKIVKPKKYRAVFFVLLAIFVLGFSLNIANAALSNPPKPGDAYNTWPAEWQNAPGAETYKNGVAPSGTMNTEYQKFLMNVGGFSDADAKKTALLNPSLKPNPNDPVVKAVNVAGGKILEVAEWGVLKVVIGVLSVIASFLKELVSYAAELLDLTLNPSLYNFTSNRMIVQGWTMVRDVCNLFFLLVLLFIALCTILKIEKYHAKKTLLTLIIMALLINFSKPIAIFIFDGSQLLMNEFLKQMGGAQGTGQTTSTVVAKASGIANIVYDTLPPNSGETAIAIQYLFGVVFLFMLAVAYVVTALMLLVRIIAIMMLIIVSPLAFFAAIIPDFSKMSSSWWSSLFEYSYYGPAAAFFLLLATNLESALPPLQNISGSSGQIDKTVNSILHYLVVLIFLYASIIMAKKFGGVAGAAVVGNANRVMKWGAGMTKGGGMWGAGARGVAWGSQTTGITGAASQRMQQSKYLRWMTKEGRKEGLEEREAALGSVIGVKGAKERQIQKRAKKYKDEHYTEEALKAMATKGDAAAAFLLSENGDMDNATYASLQGDKNYTGNVKKMVDKKLKKKQLHIFVDGQLDNFIDEQKGKTVPITYASRDLARQAFADQEFGKLSPIDVKEQDIEAISREPVFAQALRNSYTSNIPNQPKILEGMSANKYAAGQAAHIW